MFKNLFKNKQKDVPWSVLQIQGTKFWRLIELQESVPTNWDDFLKNAREYWGADEEDKQRFRYYFGQENTENNFLEKTQKSYLEQLDYQKHWNGLCKVGESIEIVHQNPEVIALSKFWKGKYSYHSDLELILREETTFWGKHVRYFCEIYSFGLMYVSSDSPEHLVLGAKVGNELVSTCHGKDVEVSYDKSSQTIAIGKAVFSVAITTNLKRQFEYFLFGKQLWEQSILRDFPELSLNKNNLHYFLLGSFYYTYTQLRKSKERKEAANCVVNSQLKGGFEKKEFVQSYRCYKPLLSKLLKPIRGRLVWQNNENGLFSLVHELNYHLFGMKHSEVSKNCFYSLCKEYLESQIDIVNEDAI